LHNVKLESDLTCGHCGTIDATELSFQSVASHLQVSPLTNQIRGAKNEVKTHRHSYCEIVQNIMARKYTSRCDTTV